MPQTSRSPSPPTKRLLQELKDHNSEPFPFLQHLGPRRDGLRRREVAPSHLSPHHLPSFTTSDNLYNPYNTSQHILQNWRNMLGPSQHQLRRRRSMVARIYSVKVSGGGVDDVEVSGGG
ncbi:MAG: hypothetical protein Q9199_006196 [Rusavskia elegans]